MLRILKATIFKRKMAQIKMATNGIRACALNGMRSLRLLNDKREKFFAIKCHSVSEANACH